MTEPEDEKVKQQQQQQQQQQLRPSVAPENIRAVRLGHGANCSSVGSVIDTLFLASAVGGAVFAAVCAAMREEPVRVVGSPDEPTGDAKSKGSTSP